MLTYLSLRERFAETLNNLTQLSDLNIAVAVLVEDLEGLADFLLSVQASHLVLHQFNKLFEIDGSVTYSLRWLELASQIFF